MAIAATREPLAISFPGKRCPWLTQSSPCLYFGPPTNHCLEHDLCCRCSQLVTATPTHYRKMILCGVYRAGTEIVHVRCKVLCSRGCIRDAFRLLSILRPMNVCRELEGHHSPMESSSILCLIGMIGSDLQPPHQADSRNASTLLLLGLEIHRDKRLELHRCATSQCCEPS